MNDENNQVVETTEEKKVPFFKRPLVRKIAKYTVIALATGGVGALAYYAGYKHGSNLSAGTEISVESLDSNI